MSKAELTVSKQAMGQQIVNQSRVAFNCNAIDNGTSHWNIKFAVQSKQQRGNFKSFILYRIETER